uniref:Uncharacterized protein n=1 Tax=Oryza rufipogon TaxID=4529 RepID=A0A0E0PWD9_ORYRU
MSSPSAAFLPSLLTGFRHSTPAVAWTGLAISRRNWRKSESGERVLRRGGEGGDTVRGGEGHGSGACVRRRRGAVRGAEEEKAETHASTRKCGAGGEDRWSGKERWGRGMES